MEEAGNVLLVSSASIWEIAIKASRGKLHAPPDLMRVLDDQGFISLSVSRDHAWRVHALPGDGRGDPFDRLLAAQALHEKLTVISGDRAFDEYGVDRLWSLSGETARP